MWNLRVFPRLVAAHLHRGRFDHDCTFRTPRASRMRDRVTLITGAASGIGAELARVFAAHGHRLALVDRNGDGLAGLARDTVAAGGEAPIAIVCDLERPDACDRIQSALRQAR